MGRDLFPSQSIRRSSIFSQHPHYVHAPSPLHHPVTKIDVLFLQPINATATMKLPRSFLLSAVAFPMAHSFLPTPHQTASLPTIQTSSQTANSGHTNYILRRTEPTVAFSSPSRLFFTPKEDNESESDTPFIRPALHNSTFFRSLAILYALLFAIYQSSSSSAIAANNALLQKMGKYLVLPPNSAATVHLLSFATWFGTVVYTTFVAGITMFKNLPRRVFGKIQSKLFPLYFQLGSVMLALQVSFSIDTMLWFALELY